MKEDKVYLKLIKDNCSICEFMGAVKVEDEIFSFVPNYRFIHKNGYSGPKFRPDRMEYHHNWKQLMPVVEKIESIHDEFHGYFAVYISSNSCTIQGTRLRLDEENPHYAYYNQIVGKSKIQATFEAVLQFIKWYNTQK